MSDRDQFHERLASMIRTLSKTASRDELAEVILKQFNQLIEPRVIALLIVEPHGTTVTRALGFDGTTLRDITTGDLSFLAAQEALERGLPCLRPEGLGFPLAFEGELVGAIGVIPRSQGDLSPALSELIELGAELAASSLVRADHEERAELKDREARVLERAGRALATSLDPEDVLREVLELVRGELGVARCAILLLDERTEELVLRQAVGYGARRGSRIPVDRGITGRVARTGDSARVDDVFLDSDYVPGVPNGRSEMTVPLLVEGILVGVVDVESTEVRAFNDQDLRILELLAGQIASAVRNAQLHQRERRRARRMELLNEATRALTEITVPDVLLGKILRLARDALSFSHCAILLVDEESGDLVVRAALGYGEIVGKRLPAGSGINGEVVSTGQATLVPDVLRDARYIPGVTGGRTEIVAPIIIDGLVVGTLDAESSEAAAFDQDDLEILSAFAAQAGTALRNARLLDRLEQRGARMSIVHRVSQAMATVLDPDEVLNEILLLARGALAFSRSAVALLDPSHQSLIVKAALGYGEVVGKEIPLRGSVTGAVIQTGEPALVRDVAEDPRYIPGSQGARCEMAVPLKVRGEVIGVLDAESERVGAFSERDLELLGVFAVHAATAIHNSRLFRRLENANAALRSSLLEMERLNSELEASAKQIKINNLQLERQVQQLKTLHRAGQAITATLDLDQTLETILRMTQEIIRTTKGTIKLMDEDTKEMTVHASTEASDEDEVERIDLPLQVGERVIGVFQLGSRSLLSDEDRRLLETLASQAAIAIENARLFENTQRTYYETLRSLAGALEARDAYTQGHSERVAQLSVQVAERLGLSPDERREIFSAAMLHDIGKIGVRDAILLKPDSLSEEEMAVIRSHPALGDAILGPLKFLGRVSVFVKHHHERWDGEGYPDKLSGKEIPLPSRIVAVVDSYDALTSDRPYRDRMSHEEALEVIRAASGAQFDPRAVDALIEVLELGAESLQSS